MITRNFVLFNPSNQTKYPIRYDLTADFCGANKNDRFISVLDFKMWKITENNTKIEYAPYVQLHADFNFDDKENNNFIMFENNEGTFFHKKCFKFNSNRRYINIWFADINGDELDIFSQPDTRYVWYIDLDLKYTPENKSNLE